MPHTELTTRDSSRIIRIGYVGLDSSHCVAFTELLHSGSIAEQRPMVHVTAAVPAGNPDFPLSRDRVEGYTRAMQALGVEIVDAVPTLLDQVDAVILGSVDGRQHLDLCRRIFPAGKPVFIDKPLAQHLGDAIRIQRLGQRYGTPWFSSSALRFQAPLSAALEQQSAGDIVGCDTWGQSRAAVGHADLAWYGIHGIEALFTVMGPGCQTVSRCRTDFSEHVTGVWSGQRIGTWRGIREETHKAGYGVMIFGTRAQQQILLPATYDGLVQQMARFFRTGVASVDEATTLEMFAFLQAADESRIRNGCPVSVPEVLERTRQQVAGSEPSDWE